MTDTTGTTGTSILSTKLDLHTCYHNSLVHKLNQEWAALYPEFRPILQRWVRQDPVLAAHGLEPDSAVELSYGHADTYLLALLDRAGRRDEEAEARWAARAVLQLMLPGVLRLSRSLRSDHEDELETEAHAVAAMHEAIVRYPVERRQRCAANVMFDAMRLARHHITAGALVRGAQVQLAPEPQDPERSDRQPMVAWPTSASEELLWLLARAVARGDLTEPQARLLADGTAYGWSRRLARELGISTSAVRQRRRYAVGKLRASVADLEATSDWLERRLDVQRRSTRRASTASPSTAEPETTRTSHSSDRQPEHACWPDAG